MDVFSQPRIQLFSNAQGFWLQLLLENPTVEKQLKSQPPLQTCEEPVKTVSTCRWLSCNANVDW